MPHKPPRPCAQPGCPNLTYDRYCLRHTVKRSSAARRGYNHRWKKYREKYLLMHPRCIICGRPADTVDHIQPITRGGSFWDPCNHQPLCKACHDRKTATEDNGFGKRPPPSVLFWGDAETARKVRIGDVSEGIRGFE